MVSCRELRARARVSLGGNIFKPQWLYALLAYGAVSIALGIVSASGIGSIAVFIFAGPIYIGLASYFLNLNRQENGHEKIANVLDGFKIGIGDNVITGLLLTLFTFLWSLLFIIPGIVKTYAYAMTYYIRLDHPEYTATQAITKSREMMKGYKGKLFLLDLSFIGWIIVGALCCGVGTLWVYPYQQMARAHFYEERKAEFDPIVPPLSEDTPTEETTEA